jgi:cation:H+ antiporter
VSPLTVVLFVAGIALLVLGADWLVRGASRIAAASGISALVIGLTVVAYGTSAPELAVSVKAAWANQADQAVGNVVGSNNSNVLFILGVSAVITPLLVAAQIIRVEVPIMIGVSALVYLMSIDGRLGRLDGAVLFAGAVMYTVMQIRQSRKESAAVKHEYDEGAAPRAASSTFASLAWIGAGISALILGSNWLVDSSVVFARVFGVSDLVIGLTIVAAGTSLPEVATSIVAALRGERDIAVGNAIGSNIFNILAVLGLTAIVAPHGVRVAPSVLYFDLPVMIAVAITCLPIFFTGSSISRFEGLIFLGCYGSYTAYLIMAAQEHDAIPFLSKVMLLFVVPLLALTLVVTVTRQVRANARNSE